MSNLTELIPDESRKLLAEFCREQDRSPSDVVRESLRRYLAVQRFAALHRKTLPFAEAQGILTDEDAFKLS